MPTESRQTGADQTASRDAAESAEARPGTLGPAESERHRILSSERRRTVLEVLADRTSPLALEDLAAAVAAREADEARCGSGTGRVAITLHHQHLPMLTDAGVLEYEPSTKRIEDVHSVAGLP